MTVREHPRDPSPRVAIAVGIVVLAAAVASVLPQLHRNTWIFRDGRFYVNVATTIVEDLSLDQHPFAASWYTGTLGWNRELDPGWSNVALGAHGEHWPKHPWIHPLIASPVFFAFGLPATLAWNLLMFALIGAGLFRFARAYSTPVPAALAVAAFVVGTAIVQSAYDFSVDVLMLALFAQGLACVLDGRGARAGVLFAICVVIKPTALMLVPALALVLAERRDGRALRRSLAAGTCVLLAYAGVNWWMYGRPWWSGYNRTLVVRAGHPVVADHLDAFSVPFDEGFVRMWGGGYGLVHTFTIVALAAPGLVALMRRRPLHALGAIASVVCSLLVFARYEYEGHRFHWPALAFLVPSIAVTIELAGRALARVRAESAAAAVAIAASGISVLPFGGTMAERVAAGGPWGAAELELVRSLGLEEQAAALIVILAHLAIAGAIAAVMVRIASRCAPAPVAAAALAACAMLPEVRDAAIAGGPVALGLLAAAIAAARAVDGRWAAASIAAAAALVAWVGLPDREPGGSALELLARTVGTPGVVRSIAPWLALGAIGAALAIRRDARGGAALAALAAIALLPGIGVRGEAWQPITALALAAPSSVAADALARAIAAAGARLHGRRAAIAVAVAFALLLAIGGVRRAIAAGEPFRFASERAVRDARVLHGEVPCDFLAWEHMGWECSHFDAGLFGMVGLALSEGVHVGGAIEELLVVPTGRSGEVRTVTWERVRAGRTLAMRWAVPDGLRGDGVLEIAADGEPVGSIEAPARGDGSVHETSFDTTALAGREVRLELRMSPPAGRRHQATIAIDGVWR